ncbi:hypothetical protein FBU59_004211, partial [Linderina macrospora]
QIDFLPGIVPEPAGRLRGLSTAGAGAGTVSHGRRASTVVRDEHTGATTLVKDRANGSLGEPAASGSLFGRDETGIRQRLRQHLAEHHQRTHSRAAYTGALDDGTGDGSAATADVLLQLEEGARELARVILTFDRYLRKVERFYGDESAGDTPAHARGSANAMRAAADARLIAHAKGMVAALAVFLQVIDDFDTFGVAVVATAIGDDEGSAEHGPAALVTTSLEAMRGARMLVSEHTGLLVASAQDFAELAQRLSGGAPEPLDDPELPASDAESSLIAPPLPERILHVLVQVGESLQALNHTTMALHIAAKRVVEACDVCDLRVLWLRVARLNVPANALASVPVGPVSGDAVRLAQGSPHMLAFRRSISLPHLRRALLEEHASPISEPDRHRPRADTVDAADHLALQMSRRVDSGDSESASPDSQQANAAARDARAKDKLSRFFGDDAAGAAYRKAKRPSQLSDITIPSIGGGSASSVKTPTRATGVFGEEPSGAAASTISSRASAKMSAGGGLASPATASAADQIPWYLAYDSSPSDLLLSAEGQVKGSTLPALIERLVAHDVSDPNFVSTFLLTYRSFTTTPELFEGLFRRFLIQAPPGLTEAELADWTERKQKPVRLRVFN